jgi:transposase-like protein
MKKSAAKRQQYSMEIKQRALAMIRAGARAAQVSRELKIPDGAIGRWKRDGVKRGAEPNAESPTAANSTGRGGEITDALLFLRHAEREIMRMIQDQKIARPDPAHLLTLLALAALQKGIAK